MASWKTSQRVDYDRIAHLYDAPDRVHDVDPNLNAFIDQRPDLDPAVLSILDVGFRPLAGRRTYPVDVGLEP